MTKIKILTSIAFLAVILSIIFPYFAVVTAEKIKCAHFKTQQEANKHYQPILDRDHDGLACESLLKK